MRDASPRLQNNEPIRISILLAPINFPRNLWNQTIRQIARVSLGGSQVRVVLSNEYGTQPLVIGAASIGLSDGGAAIKAGSDRVLMGVNALARFDEDVLSHQRADTLILMMGINDIGWPDSVLDPSAAAPSAEDIIDGYEQLIARAHDHGMRIIGATLTPFDAAFKGTPLEGHYSADKEAKRVAVNEWIRTSGAFDGVIDFDAVVRDPARPTRILPAYDKGDNLHPNDAGYKAMAESIDLGILKAKP